MNTLNLSLQKYEFKSIGGETGIRTLETREGLLVFKTSAFNRSAISPFLWIKHFKDF